MYTINRDQMPHSHPPLHLRDEHPRLADRYLSTRRAMKSRRTTVPASVKTAIIRI